MLSLVVIKDLVGTTLSFEKEAGPINYYIISEGEGETGQLI